MGIQALGVVIIVIAVSAMGSACTSQQHAEDASSGSGEVRDKAGASAALHPVATGRISLPASLRGSSVQDVKVYSSWESAINQQIPADREFLESANARYLGSLGFDSEQEQRRLIAQGFPMPEEWLASRAKSMDELRALAEQGDAKARMFFIDRVVEGFTPERVARGLDADDPAEARLADDFAQATVWVGDLIREVRTPFAGYLAGQLYSPGGQVYRAEPIAAGLQVAAELGDQRALRFSETFHKNNPQMDAGAVRSSHARLVPPAK